MCANHIQQLATKKVFEPTKAQTNVEDNQIGKRKSKNPIEAINKSMNQMRISTNNSQENNSN